MTDYVIPLTWPEYEITVFDQGFEGPGHAGVVSRWINWHY